ncbi:TrbI/VirB10 family protein [Blastomonas sp. AAP53]|uniref:TrbI/VirB10 family protein n=1 Tax=Blastomonas sp. AAP53 TaxID=1248760 RepID=UPI0003037A29|nr:TrbI/VirB10 family protein [Blastomonas sp. AAP53]
MNEAQSANTDAADEKPEKVSKPGTIEPDSVIRLRDDPPRVMRLSRKAIASAAAVSGCILAGALIYALLPEAEKPATELFNIGGVAVPEAFTSGRGDYTHVPKLGPPLPGDLGKPILDASTRPQIASLPPPANPIPPVLAQPASLPERRDNIGEERDAARASRLFFEGRGDAPERQPELQDLASPALPTSQAEDQTQRLHTRQPQNLQAPQAARVLHAGSVIAAALITGIKSDIPGLVTAQVTENVYDSISGKTLLIPQGTRLIGEYSSSVSFGQNRIQLAWTRLIMPDGRSVTLDLQPAADVSGYSGLADKTDYHWAGVFRAALVSTLLGAGAEFGVGSDDNLVRAFRRGSQDSLNRAGEQIVARELNVRPTLTIRPGSPVRVMVTRDLVIGDAQ